ncbi:DUF2513 domain-containing protein [Vibrio vulnificus]
MQKLLDVFIESPKAYITIDDLGDAGIIIEDDTGLFDERFIFHLGLLLDNNMISNKKFESCNLDSIGIDTHNNSSHYYTETDIRLTQCGHDFAKLLHQNEVIEALKDNFKEYPFKVMLEAGKELSTTFMKKKLKELTGISE